MIGPLRAEPEELGVEGRRCSEVASAAVGSMASGGASLKGRYRPRVTPHGGQQGGREAEDPPGGGGGGGKGRGVIAGVQQSKHVSADFSDTTE